MKQYQYSVQAKITVWEETFYTFHAESREKAEEIIKQVAKEGIYSIKDEKLQSELDNYQWNLIEETIGDLDANLQPIEIYDENQEIIDSFFKPIN